MISPAKVSRSMIAAQPRVGEGARPAGERLIAGDGDRGGLLALGEHLEQHLRAAAVELHVAELINTQQIDPAVAGDRLGQLALVGGLDQLVDRFRREGVADPPAVLRGGGAQPDQQVRLAGAGVTDQAEWVALADPLAASAMVNGGRVDVRVGLEVEVLDPLLPREPGGLDPPHRAAAIPVVAFGQHKATSYPHPTLLTLSQVAERLQVSRWIVYQPIWAGELPSVHLGSCHRIRTQDVDRYIDELLDDR